MQKNADGKIIKDLSRQFVVGTNHWRAW